MKPQPDCATENKDHLLRAQRCLRPVPLPYLSHYAWSYRPSDLCPPEQVEETVNTPEEPHRLTQNTLDVLRGRGLRASAAAQHDHSAQNAVFTGQEGRTWARRANATSGTTKL